MAIQVGSLVIFDWWSSYSAMSTSIDAITGKNVWVDITPGDLGLVIDIDESGILTHMSNGYTVKIHPSMLVLADQ